MLPFPSNSCFPQCQPPAKGCQAASRSMKTSHPCWSSQVLILQDHDRTRLVDTYFRHAPWLCCHFRLGLRVHHAALWAVAPSRPALGFVVIVFVNFHLPCRCLKRLPPLVPCRFRRGRMMVCWRLLLHRRQCWRVVRRLGRMIALVRPALLFVPDFRRVTLMRYRRRWLPSTGRTRSPPRWRRLAIWRRRSTMSMTLDSASCLIVGRGLVREFVIIFGLIGSLEPRWRPFLSRGRFSSSKRFSGRRGSRG